MKAFITECGNYGVFPFEKQWMIVYHNEQLEVFKTQSQCKKFIKKHRQTINPKPETPKKPTRTKTTSKTVSPKKPTRKRTPKVEAVAKPRTTRKTKK